MGRIVALAFGIVGAIGPTANAQFFEDDIYVSSWTTTLYRVEPDTWKVSTFADYQDGLNGCSALAFSPDDMLLCSNYHSIEIMEFDSGGHGWMLHDQTALLAPYGANGLAFDRGDNLFVSDFTGHRIVVFPAGGAPPYDFADSTDGLLYPDALAFTAGGDLLVGNRGTMKVLQFDPAGNVTPFDSLPEDPYTLVIRRNGDVYVGCQSPTATITIYRYAGGDPTQRTLLLAPPNNTGSPSLLMSRDDATLFLTSYQTGNLLAIDPDDGTWSEVLVAGSLPGAIALTVFGPREQARWTNYGAGYPGTNGIPAFTARANPVLGTTITIDLANSYSKPTVGVIFLGFEPTVIHSAWGGDLLVVPAISLPISFSYGANWFDWSVPNDPRLSGLAIDLQSFEADPGAAEGVSFTAGLELVLGY